MSTNPLLDAAVSYAQRGWPVFPVKPGAKVPLTPGGLKDASRAQEQLVEWWRRWPDANVAVRTGTESGLVVLDVDGDAGADSLHELERAHGPLPTTASVCTPRGGAHYYFAHPGGEVHNSAGLLGQGLDIRGDGGYVLAPPSRGLGRRYEPDERAPIAALPVWLLERIKPPQGRKREPVDTWIRIVRDGLPQGQRNAGIARLAGHLLARDVDVRLVAEIAHLVDGRNRPPLGVDEVDKIVESIAGCEIRKRKGRR